MATTTNFEKCSIYDSPKKGDVLVCECCEREFVYDGAGWLFCGECLDRMVMELT